MKKILIVDDEKMVLMVAKRVLSQHYETVCAASGKEALELFEKEKPDMLLSDLLMPEMSGFELHKQLEEKYKTHIPVMFMTADESGEIEGKGFESGADDFIRKPFHSDVLLKRVENILSNIERISNLTAEATIDNLTGFYNKACITAKLSKICESEVGTLMVIDLDSFKLVNDIYGHDMGDKLLDSFSDVIRNNTRSEDMIGRIGGDEFVVFCGGIIEENAVAGIVRRINDQLVAAAKSLMGDNMNIPIGVSAGAVFVPKQGRDYAELFNMADKALYFVKQNEKHGYSIYAQKYDGISDDEETEAQAFHRLSLVMEERNISDAAFWLGQDAFAHVYRFMMRYIQSYRGIAYKAFFTVTPRDKDVNGAELAAAMEQFGMILNKSLRKSDIMMQSGYNRYFLLLPEITDKYIEKVISRVLEQWSVTEYAKKADISYLTEGIYAEDLDERERRRTH